MDRYGRIQLCNSQSETIFGYSKEELLDQPVEILIPEDLRQGHAPASGAYHAAPSYRPMGTGLALSGRRKDGSTFPVEISLSPWEDEGKHLVMASIRDVTERRKAEERLRQSEERFRSLVEEVKDYAIFMLDPGGRIMSWNEGAQAIKGYSADEIIGQHFSRFYASDDIERGKPDEELRIAAIEGRWEDEGWRIRKDGSRFWADVVITALHDKEGNLLGFTKITRDITEGKRAREAFLLEVTNTLVSNLDVIQAAVRHRFLSPPGQAVRLCRPSRSMTSQRKCCVFRRFNPRPDQAPMLRNPVLVPIESSPAGWAYTTRKPLLLKGLSSEKWPFEMPSDLAHASLKSGCWIPLVGRDACPGNLKHIQPARGEFYRARCRTAHPDCRPGGGGAG